MDEKDLSVA